PLAIPCAQDSQGNQVCISTQPDANICGYTRFPGGVGSPIQCNDVAVRKTGPEGELVFTRVLGGESDERPAQFFLDSEDNVVLLGTTYSTRFPRTADAVARPYSGPPPPPSSYGFPLPPGGDLFLSIVSPSGDLLYSTFLGSAGNDTVLGVRAAENG